MEFTIEEIELLPFEQPIEKNGQWFMRGKEDPETKSEFWIADKGSSVDNLLAYYHHRTHESNSN